MDVFKKYWHVMKEKSELTRQTLNDDIENEVQRLKHINQMCRKMSRAARRIGLSYNNLIDSEQMFHDILNEPADQNDSLSEDFCNTSALQQDVISVEEGLKCKKREYHVKFIASFNIFRLFKHSNNISLPSVSSRVRRFCQEYGWPLRRTCH